MSTGPEVNSGTGYRRQSAVLTEIDIRQCGAVFGDNNNIAYRRTWRPSSQDTLAPGMRGVQPIAAPLWWLLVSLKGRAWGQFVLERHTINVDQPPYTERYLGKDLTSQYFPDTPGIGIRHHLGFGGNGADMRGSGLDGNPRSCGLRVGKGLCLAFVLQRCS
jgi:hypothetical protein